MAIHLSDVLSDKLEKKLAMARKLVEQNDLQKAAAAYAQAAELMKQYAESAVSSETRMKRLADAGKLRSCAEQLRQGKVLSSQGEAYSAAVAYAQAAKLMKRYAKSAAGSDIKKERLADADKLQSCAGQPQQDKVPSPQDEVSGAACDREITSEEDDYT